MRDAGCTSLSAVLDNFTNLEELDLRSASNIFSLCACVPAQKPFRGGCTLIFCRVQQWKPHWEYRLSSNLLGNAKAQRPQDSGFQVLLHLGHVPMTANVIAWDQFYILARHFSSSLN